MASLAESAEANDLVAAANALRPLVDIAPDAMIVVDAGRIVLANAQTERLFGYTQDELVGSSINMLMPKRFHASHAAHHEDYARDPRTRRMGQSDTLPALHKDGREILVQISLAPAAGGKLVMASICDVTARVHLEAALRKTQDQLRQAQKMEAIGRLAGGVAHDFNNILCVILSYASLVIEELKPCDPLREQVEEIARAGERARDLTRQLLAFSRQKLPSPGVLDLNRVVTGTEKMLRRLLGEDVELSLLTSTAIGKVVADTGQLEQVLVNLAVNARDAMPRGGKLSVETRNVDLDEAYAAMHAGVVAGPYVMLAVTDTGSGMDAATQERIFEPFFTTKEPGKGTGLGLATVFGIVKQSSGHIWVYSELGVGTTFKVYLPRSDRDADAPSVAPSEPPISRGSATILIVEDEPQVRAITKTILRKNGYNVLEAQNGGEAFLVCEQYGAKIHLLLTDVVMPRMSGRELVERVAPLRPEMKVLFVSGYTGDALVHHGVLDGGVAFLQKPITPPSLLKKVREVLG